MYDMNSPSDLKRAIDRSRRTLDYRGPRERFIARLASVRFNFQFHIISRIDIVHLLPVYSVGTLQLEDSKTKQ